MILTAWGAACSNSTFDKCVGGVCQHVFYDCQGVIKIGNEIITASDYPACVAKCQELTDAGGGPCQDLGAGFDCIGSTSCDVFLPGSGLDAGQALAECEAKAKCATQ
jgi:hypothetical protein